MKKEEFEGPFILVLETATDVGSVGLYSGDSLLGHQDIHVGRMHARLLMPMVRQLLENLQIEKGQIDAVAISKGPGSYTGLRVGVSTAKGLCMAWDIPLMALTSLELLALQVEKWAFELQAYICPMIDARRMEVYTALYDSKMEEVRGIHALVLDNNSFEKELDEDKIIFIGDGALKAEKLLGSHPYSLFIPHIRSSTQHIGRSLLQRFRSKNFEDLQRFEPYYLKDFVATKPKDKLR